MRPECNRTPIKEKEMERKRQRIREKQNFAFVNIIIPLVLTFFAPQMIT